MRSLHDVQSPYKAYNKLSDIMVRLLASISDHYTILNHHVKLQ